MLRSSTSSTARPTPVPAAGRALTRSLRASAGAISTRRSRPMPYGRGGQCVGVPRPARWHGRSSIAGHVPRLSTKVDKLATRIGADGHPARGTANGVPSQGHGVRPRRWVTQERPQERASSYAARRTCGVTCPQCQGTAHRLIVPNYLECTSVVMRSAIAPVGPGGSFVGVSQPAVCGKRFHSSSSATPGLPVCPCGTYSIGVCAECGGRVCGDHSGLVEGRRLCGVLCWGPAGGEGDG